jgi:methionyl-tRNA synthetase
MGARDFRSAINARLIGLCAHCLVHSGGSKCERCGRMLVDAAGEPMTTVRKSPYIEETKPIPVQLHRP